MKNILCVKCFPIISFFILFSNVSCKKESFNLPQVASLTVGNFVIGGKPIRIGSIVTPVANNNSAQLTVRSGTGELYVWPVGDSAKPYYTNSKIITEHNRIYSLFLAGQLSDISGLLLEDDFPYHTDSTLGVRFINLSPNSPALNITLSITPTKNEVSNIAYLNSTEFKIYPAKSINANYLFQIRKASDNTILLNYNLITPRFTNVTLVIKGEFGKISGPTAFSIWRINNDR